MKQTLQLLCCCLLWGVFLSSSVSGQFEFQQQKDRIIITSAGRPVATYVFRDEKISRPYFAHVHSPSRQQVTRNHPPVLGKDATDHADYHPGIWLAFGDISGHDYWRLGARVVHEKFLEKPHTKNNEGGFTVRNRYLSSDGSKTVCQEDCRYRWLVRPSGYLLIWESRFSSDDEDFYFGDQEEMGLAIRVASPVAVENGGRITDSQGRINGSQIWGKQSQWCDYSGTIEGKHQGMTLMPDPKNFRRCWFHARDYGFVAANPFGRNAFTKEAKSKVIVPKGRALRLCWGILLHSSNAKQPLDLSAAYRDFLEQLKTDRR